MDLLIDVNVALDYCAKRQPHFAAARDAIELCRFRGGRLWLYAGSVQTLEYNLCAELRRDALAKGENHSSRQISSASPWQLHRVLHHGNYIMGPEIAELDTALAEYVGVNYCLTVDSGTDRLELALRALGIGPGDEVITVPFTWISSAEIISLVGATPVFVDIEPESFNINVALIEAAITSRTKAILPVSLFGQMPDYAAINAIAARHGLTVIEDAAQSFGATQNGQRSCAMTTVASTSFFPAKPFGCYGDGGALFTDDGHLAEKMSAIRTHGGTRRHHHPLLGMNGRFDTLQAAVLLAKWPLFEHEVAARGRIGARYTEQLSDLCRAPGVMPGNTHVYAQYTIRLADRDQVGAALKAQGVPTAVYYPKCLHEQPVFAALGYRWGDFPEAERVSREVLSLPMHPFLEESKQDRVYETRYTLRYGI